MIHLLDESLSVGDTVRVLAIVVRHQAHHLLLLPPYQHILCISDHIRQPNPLQPDQTLIVHISRIVPVRVRESLDKVDPIGVREEKSTDVIRRTGENIDGERVGGGFDDRVSAERKG
jgi:hypothetical protein